MLFDYFKHIKLKKVTIFQRRFNFLWPTVVIFQISFNELNNFEIYKI